jgi:DNA repair photolyase
MKVNLKEVKQIITRSNLPAADYVINPYIGCQHSCIYCYADFMKRFTGHTGEKWGDFVDIRINAHKTIKNKSYGNKSILIGSVTDPYQPIESKYKITRNILEKLVLFQPNLGILTKSKLIKRDIELLKKFTNLRIGVSLNTINDNISKCLEPHASSANSRISTLKELYNAGLKTYLFISPIFPDLTDFKELVEKVHPFVYEVAFENLNIRPNNRKAVYSFVKKHMPNNFKLYSELKPDCSYWNNYEKQIIDFCMLRKIRFRIFFNHTATKSVK